MSSKSLEPKGPAKWIDRFLEWYCADHLVEEIQGDLREAYHYRSIRKGQKRANFRYFLDVLLFFRPSSFKKIDPNKNTVSMHQSYYKSALRNFSRNKAYGSINLLGLIIGISSCLIITLHVMKELSYDKFHPNHENKYRLVMDMFHNNELAAKSAPIFPAVGPGMVEDYPEVLSYLRILPFGNGVYSVKQADGTLVRFNEERGVFADENFFEMFGFELEDGNPKEVLKEKNQIVISASTANRYFGDQDPIGKTILYRGQRPMVVSGVMADFPENSHMQFDLISSLRTWDGFEEWPQNWGWYDFYTFIEIAAGTDVAQLNEKTSGYLKMKNGEIYETENMLDVLELQQLGGIHLHSKGYSWEMGQNGGAQGVYFLSIIAILVLLIAWVNFINLSTARAVKRAHEVGIRKVIGALRGQLVHQFLFEAFLLNVIAILFSVGIVALFTPSINSALGVALDRSLLVSSPLLIGMAALWVVGSLISGLYPAFVLSAFQPLKVLKGNLYNRRKRFGFRQVLVTLQFATSIILILGTFVVVSQLRYMQSKDLGMDMEQTLVLKGPSSSRGDDDLTERRDIFEDQIQQVAAIKGFTVSSIVPGTENFSISNFFTRENPDAGKHCYRVRVDENYFENYGVEILTGRNFIKDMASDSNAVLINRTAASLFGFTPETAIGEIFNPGERYRWRVIGVVEDYHHSSLKESLDPMMFFYRRGNNDYFSLKLAVGDLFNTLTDIEAVWDEVYPDNPFDFFFLDEYFDQQYRGEKQFNAVFGGFAALAIAVACMGLFGLVSFSIEQSRKEIGIRKVLGASIGKVVLLFAKDYAWMIGLAVLIAFPLGYYLMNNWLQDFAYQIQLHPGFFILSACIILSIALVTVGFKSFQAANSNPVDSLREE